MISVEEIHKLEKHSERDDYLVIQFNRVDDVPEYGAGYFLNGTRQDIYIKSYISKDLAQTIPGMMSLNDFGDGPNRDKDYEEYLKITNNVRQIGRLSDNHFTLRKHDSGSAIWNSYHNYKMKPSQLGKNALLTVELYHASRKQSVATAQRAFQHGQQADAAHGMLGVVHIPLHELIDNNNDNNTNTNKKEHEFQTYYFNRNHHELSHTQIKYPNFSVKLRRLYQNSPPPRIKTFFMIRHGESKWNLAQEKGSISGMLHRDHSLTLTGANQAKGFNTAWRRYIDRTEGKTLSQLHDDEVATYVDAKYIITEDDRKHHRKNHQLTENEKAILNGKPLSYVEQTRPVVKKKVSFLSKIKGKLWSGKTKEKSDNSNSNSNRNSNSHDDNTIKSADGDGDVDGDYDDNRSRSSSIDMDMEDIPAPPTSPTSATTAASLDLGKSDKGIINNNNDDNDNDNEESVFTHVEDISKRLITKTEKKILMPASLVKQRLEYIKQFLHADGVHVSPLTRAIQTALFTLEMHPAMYGDGKGLNIMSTIREFKGVGGIDTVGRVIGKEIKTRTFDEIIDIFDEHEAIRTASHIDFNYGDAELHWWTDINHFEGKKEMNERMCEFIDFAQFTYEVNPIFVGHSNFFRYFYSNYLSDIISHNRPTLCADLRKNRLSNACGLAVTVLFEEEEDYDDDDDDNYGSSSGDNIIGNNKNRSRGNSITDFLQGIGSGDNNDNSDPHPKVGEKHGSSNARYNQDRGKHVARIIDADVIFSDHRLSFANGNKISKEFNSNDNDSSSKKIEVEP
jgi:broad specificity phosphatase PhoE